MIDKNKYRILLLCVVAITHIDGAPLGCYKENTRRSRYNVNPGAIGPGELEPGICRTLCGGLNFQYAALRGHVGAKACYCGTQAPLVVDQDLTNTLCNDACETGADKCGSSTHSLVYDSLPAMKMSLTTSASEARIGQLVSFTPAVVTSAINWKTRCNFDDQAGFTDYQTANAGLGTHAFYKAGVHNVVYRLTSSDNVYPEVEYGRRVRVYSPPQGFTLSCPSDMATHTKSRCIGTLLRGTGVQISVYYNDPTPVVKTWSMDDATERTFGNPVQMNPMTPPGSANAGAGGLVLLQGSQANYGGNLVAFHYHARGTGSLTVHIYRPDCGGNDYCYATNDCPATCTPTCGGMYCSDVGCCCSGPLPRSTGLQASYSLVYSSPATPVTAGHGAIDLYGLGPAILRGDIVGYELTVADLLSVRTAGSNVDYFCTGQVGGPATIAAGACAPTTENVMLEAIYAQPSMTPMDFLFTTTETARNISAVVRSNKPSIITEEAGDSALVNVLEGVDRCIIVMPQCLQAGLVYTFFVAPFTGTGAQVAMVFDDGNTGMGSTTNDVSHSYATAGTYTLSVNISNALTWKSNTSIICVEERITDLSLWTTPGQMVLELGVVTPLTLYMTSGSDYTCVLGVTYAGLPRVTQDLTYSTNAPNSTINIIFDREDAVTLDLACSNKLGSASWSMSGVVQERLAGVALSPGGAMANTLFKYTVVWTTGSAVALTVTVDGLLMPMTMDADNKRAISTTQSGEPMGTTHAVDVVASNLLSSVTLSETFMIQSPCDLVIVTPSFLGLITSPTAPSGTKVISFGSSVDISISMSVGTGVNVTINYCDGTPDYTFSAPTTTDWNSAGGKPTFPISHTYNKLVDCEIVVTVLNNVNTVIRRFPIVTVVDLAGIALTLLTAPQIYTPPAVHDFAWTVPVGLPSPLKVWAEIKWGEGNYDIWEGNDLLDLSQPLMHEYLDKSGALPLEWKIWNYFTNVSGSFPVDVVAPLFNITLRTSSDAGMPNVAIDLVLMAYRAPGPGDCNLVWNCGDGAGATGNVARTGESPFGTDTHSCTYPGTGSYTASVTIITLLDTQTISTNVDIMDAPQDGLISITTDMPKDYQPLAPGPCGATFQVDHALPTPDPSTQISFDFGDGNTAGPFIYTTPFVQLHTYATHGAYVTTISIENNAQTVTKIIDSGCYASFVAPTTAQILRIPTLPVGAVPVVGFGVAQKEFVNSELLDIKPSFSGGTNQWWEVTAVSGGNIFTCNSTDFTNSIPFSIPMPGVYTINIQARNYFYSSPVFTDIIEIYVAPGEMTFNDGNITTGPNNPKSIDVVMDRYGTDQCLACLDGSNTDEVHVYGNFAKCSVVTSVTVWPSRVVVYDPSVDVSTAFTLTYTYTKPRDYLLECYAWNDYGSSTSPQTFSFPISNIPCTRPYPYIETPFKDFQNPQPFYRSKPVSKEGNVDIDCLETLANRKKWTVVEWDAANNVALGEVPLSSETAYNARMVISARSLPLGLYQAKYRVEMKTGGNTGADFAGDSFTFFEVVPSQLVVQTYSYGVTDVTHGADDTFSISPTEHSYDPDVPANDNDVFDWFELSCIDLSSGESHQPKTVTITAPALDAPPPATFSGCWGGGPGWLTGFTGDAMFNASHMQPGNTYEFQVIGHKDTRQATFTSRVHIVAGTIPKASIGFIQAKITTIEMAGKGVLFNPSGTVGMRVSLEETCPDCTYTWELFVFDYNFFGPPYYLWRPLVYLDYYIQGINSEELGIDPYVWQHYSGFNRFKAQCTVCSNTSFSDCNVISVEMFRNTPPHNGICTVTPTVGDSLVTRHDFLCSGFIDDDHEIKDYTLYCGGSLMETSEVPQFTDLILPHGVSSNGYQLDCEVHVKDELGSIGTFSLPSITSNALSMADLRTELSSINITIGQIAAQGNLKHVTGYLAAIGPALIDLSNYDEQTGYAGNGIYPSWMRTGLNNNIPRYGAFDEPQPDAPAVEQYEEDRDLCGSVVQQLSTALAAATVESMADIRSAFECMAVIAPAQSNLPIVAQQNMLGVLKSGISGLTNLQQTTSVEDVTQVIDDLTSICQNMQEATVVNKQLPSRGDLARQRVPVLTFPTNLDADAADFYYNPAAMTPEEAMEKGMRSLCDRDNVRFAVTLESDCTRLKTKAVTTLGLIKASSTIPTSLTSDRVETQIYNTKAGQVKGLTVASSAGSIGLPAIMSGLSDDEPITLTVEGATSCGQVTTDDASSPADTCSRCMSASFHSSNGQEKKISNLPDLINIEIGRDSNCKRENDTALPMVNPQVIRPTDNGIIRSFVITKENAALSITFLDVTNQTLDHQMLVLVDFNKAPGLPNPKWSCLIPSNTLDRDQTCSSEETNPWVCHVPGYVVGNNIGPWKIRIVQLFQYEINLYTSLKALPATMHWAGRQFVQDFALKFVELACPYTESGSSEMQTAGCYPQPSCSGNKVKCSCNHLTSFAGGWVVAPNTIDWDFVFSNMDFFKNPTLYITEIVILVTYILAMIWARRKDRQDLELLGLAPLLDNDPRDKYYYEIMVNTGMRRNAGTESKVHFILSGEEDETDVRTFTDKKRKIFQRGQTDGFLMAVESPLGALSYLRIWHDNSGKGKTASWYVNHVIIRDIQTDRKYYFIANKWFAVEEEDGQVDRVIPVAGKEQMTEFSYMFAERASKNLSDGHLWFSVVARPPQSRFTRCQRVSACLCLLFMSMLANAMFYGTEDSDNSAYQFGPFAITPEQIFIGIAANLLIFPVNFLIITLFRKSRPRKLRPSRVEEALKSTPERTTSMTDVNMRVKSSMSTDRPGSSFLIDAKRSESAMNRPESVLSAETTAALAQTKKKKKKCTLPWWFVVVAWILLWITVLVSAAFVTFYGIMFQDIKCKKWITSMLVSFFTSIFFTQPIKVFLFAIIFSLIIKNPGGDEDEEEDEEPTKKLDTDEELLHKDEDGYGLTAPTRPMYKPKPPDSKSLEAARQQRMKEIKMWSVIREILFYAFFLWILLVISYKSVSSNSYHYKYSMEKIFIIEKNHSHSFKEIKNVESYWVWAQTKMLRGLRAGPYYNNFPAFNMRGYIDDKVSRIMGYAVLRQLRVKPDSCKIPPQVGNIIDECNAPYSYNVEQSENFGPGWTPTINASREEYIYQSAESLNGYPHWGEMGMYSGGGYIVRLNKDWADMIAQLKTLEQERWIDEYTRAVFLEFTVYNPQINMFAISTLVAEFRPSGGVFPAYRFEPATLLPYMSSVLLFQIVCEIIYFLFTCYFVIKEARSFYQQRMEYFKQFWNIIELFICAMSITAIVIYFYRLVCINELTEYFEATQGNGYMKFQYVGYWSEIFSYIIGFLVYFACLKFLKLLRFNKKVSLLADTLKNSAKDLIHFSIIFNIVFLAFIQVFYLIYVARIDTFKTFMSSCEAGIVMMMGKFDIYNMLEVNQWLTQIFLFLFVVTITFIIVNMFLSILNDTFSAVRNNKNKQNNDYEIVEFMMSRFKLWTGLGRGENTTMNPADMEKQRRRNPNTLEGQIDYFPDQIDRFLASISNMYMEKSKFDDFLHKGAVGKMAAKAQKFGGGPSAMHPAPKPGATRLSAGASGMTDVQTD